MAWIWIWIGLLATVEGSAAPVVEHVLDGGVVAQAAVDLRLGQQVLVTGADVSVPDAGKLVLGKGHHLLLVGLRNGVELLDGAVDGLDDVGEDGVLGVVHPAVGDALEGQVEHGRLDLFLVVEVGGVDALEGLLDDPGDDLVLVDALDGLGLLEDVLCAGVEVVLEADLFADEELGGGGGTERRELLRMER